MGYRGLLITTALLPLLACGGGGSSEDAPGLSLGVEEVTSGGQQASGAEETSPGPGAATRSPALSSAPGSAPASAAAGETGVEPASMVVDLDAQRIFLPNDGWLTAAAFWDLYYSHAERLPEGIDFDAVNRLGPMPPAPTAAR